MNCRPRELNRALRSGFLLSSLLSLAACSSGGEDPTESGGRSNSGGSKAGSSTGGSSSGAGVSTGGKGGTEEGFDCTATAEPGEVVAVDAGEFMMGCNEAVDEDCSEDEAPLHTVTLSAFEIDRTEVTQAQYTACVVDGACELPTCEWNCDEAELPASCVTWSHANAYCAWANKRLPTEAEWEKAARGAEGNKYPWGNEEPDCSRANMAGCGAEARPAGSLAAGASPYGALDMAGNMVELVADWYDASYYESSPAEDPQGPSTGTRYSGRGGGFKSDSEYLRTSKRDWYDPTDSAPSLGFRCAR